MWKGVFHYGKKKKQQNKQPAAAPTAMDSTTPMQQASKVEMMLAQLVIRHGERVIMNDVEDEEGNHYSLTVAQYIYYNLAADNLSLHNDLFNKILHEACEHSTEPGFKAEPYFINHEDINMSKLATDMSMDRYHLSQRKADGPDNEEAQLQAERNQTESLRNQTIHLLLDFRMDYVEAQLKEIQAKMRTVANDMEQLKALMEQFRDMQMLRNQLARQLGSNIVV